ncbi:MAG: SAM-dependent chlorinase/fluorinase [Taibaiella sp.]|nr:SAM-dependent chlorinase/fluorinase [Taibaiella sp.]
MAVITLLSDLGLNDASAGAVKGMILSKLPDAALIDISHEVPPFGIQQASYLLRTSWSDFPAGTIHIVLVDTFYAAPARLLLCEFEGHFFLVPDNGIIQSALDGKPNKYRLCFESGNQTNFRDWVLAAAGVAGSIREKGVAGIQLSIYEPAAGTARKFDPSNCEVLYIDYFGNVVTNITRPVFDKPGAVRRFRLLFMKVYELTSLSQSYNEVAPGESLCRFNRHGYMEICVNQGSAASLFGLRMGSRHNEIKIVLE